MPDALGPMTMAPSDAPTDSAPPSPAQPQPRGPQVGQIVTLPPLSPDERARRHRVADAWKAYKGEWGAGPLRVQPGDPDDNVRPNRCQSIVDTGVTYLFGESLPVEVANDTNSTGPQSGGVNAVDNGAQAGTSPAQAFLDDCWGDEDDMMTTLAEVAMNGGVAGSAFVMIVPANPNAGQPLPHLVVLDSQNVTAITDPHDVKTVSEYWIQYEFTQADASGTEQKVAYRKVISRVDPDDLAWETGLQQDADDTWEILDYVRQGGDAAWRLMARTDWPKPWPPIISCQNLPNPNEFWGLPDLPPDLIAMNRALIFNESNINRIIKHFAHPVRYASGVTAAQLNTTPDNIILFQSPDAKLSALDARADLANAMAFAAILRADMDEQSQIPSVALGRMSEIPRGQLSGVTIKTLYNPIMAKTTKKRRLYGRLIREVSRRFLELGGFAAAAHADIRLHWQDPMPADDLQQAQTAQAWMAIGVSKDTLMQRGGFDPDVESEKAQQEQQRQMTSYARGQGLPPVPGVPGQPGAPVLPGAPGSGLGAGGNPPPVNHPAAIAARAAVSAAVPPATARAATRATRNGGPNTSD